jgi:hypothetical protein
MIDDYNAGRDSVELFFEKLLALFDILLKPRPELTAEEGEPVKIAARTVTTPRCRNVLFRADALSFL